ncbi:hypothetical protein E7X23_26195, partial [Bacteroides fragilis]
SGSEKLYSIKVYNASETAIPDMILCKPLMHYIRANYPGSRTQVGLYRSVVESEQSVSGSEKLYSIKVYNASETAIPDMILCKPLMHYIR